MRTVLFWVLVVAYPGILFVFGFVLSEDPKTLVSLQQSLALAEESVDSIELDGRLSELVKRDSEETNEFDEDLTGVLERTYDGSNSNDSVPQPKRPSSNASDPTGLDDYRWWKRHSADWEMFGPDGLIERIEESKAKLFRTLVARVALLIVVFFILLFFLRNSRWRQLPNLFVDPVPPGFCRKCHYVLEGNQSGVCPECGTAVAAETHAATNLQS